MQTHWIKLDSVHSTNSYISELIKDDKAPECLVVLADYQDAGKGQHLNQWHSERGKNLLMSIALYPAFLSASEQFCLSKMTSLSIIDFLSFLGLESRIKWPNDILAGSGKIAGILIENGITGQIISHTIVGIGLNLNQESFPGYPVKATSLVNEGEVILEPEKAAEILVGRLMERYAMLKQGRAATLNEDYLEHLHGLDQELQFEDAEGSFQGIIRGINDLGQLQVERDAVVKAYGFQEIKLLAGNI